MGIDPLIQPAHRNGPQEKQSSGGWFYVICLSALGCYANAAAYGFQYPAGADYNLFLPLANWLRDPSMYPGDAIRDAFPHVQTFYWPVVAMLSKHFTPEHVLFGFFLITKLIFFAAVGLLIASRVRSRLLGACMVSALALSGMLNSQTPIGGTIILGEVSEHAALGLTIVLLAGVLLVQGKWRSAAIAAALAVYADALPFVHILPAFALFALVDWQERKRQIVSAGLLGAGIFLPWYIHFHRSFLTNYPSDYVSVLLIHYPLHITLRWTPVPQIIETAIIVAATASMGYLAKRGKLKLERRLELLMVSCAVVTLVGIIAGWFWLTPSAARFMLMRADALVIPFAFLLIQIYGAALLEMKIAGRPAAACVLAVTAILLPLCDYPAILLIPAMILWLDQKKRLDRFLAATLRRFWNPIPVIPISRIAAGLCAIGILVSFFFLTPSTDQLWNFQIPANPNESDCYGAQIWARDHTPREATFLVPPNGCGFRALSQRSSWGEWSDGNAMYFYPAFADTFLKRVAVLDPAPGPQGTGIIDSMTEVYNQQTWNRIRAVANENNLEFIVQFAVTKYPVEPVYENATFAIYRAR